MYVIAGATGRVGSAAARNLLAAGAEVRVLVRRRSDAEAWEADGAEAYVVSLDDRTTLGEALRGCAGFFALLPFDLTVDDLDANADRLIASIAGAVADAEMPHVVMLSSGGADLVEDTGPITGLYRLEKALRAAGTTLTALRSGHFQEKVGDVIGVARQSGVYPVFAASADVPLPMVATADLGAVASERLQSPSSASESADIVGPAYSERDIAALLGHALGQELQVVSVPEEGWVDALVEAGFCPHIAESLAELYRADELGLLAPRGDRSVRVHTPVEATIASLLGTR